MPQLAVLWFAFALPALAIRLAVSSVRIESPSDLLQIVIPYALVACAPIAGGVIGHAAAPGLRAQPAYRFAWFGHWRAIGPVEARAHPLYGPAGLLTSLLVGMLIGVVLRTAQYLFSVPALNMHAPAWAYTLFLAMGFQLAAMNFFYIVCFIMALKAVPLFPRMLVYVWMTDVLSQVAIAYAAGEGGAPSQVGQPLAAVLNANIEAVVFGAAIWLPYILLSKRVNVTFRHRVAATAS